MRTQTSSLQSLLFLRWWISWKTVLYIASQQVFYIFSWLFLVAFCKRQRVAIETSTAGLLGKHQTFPHFQSQNFGEQRGAVLRYELSSMPEMIETCHGKGCSGCCGVMKHKTHRALTMSFRCILVGASCAFPTLWSWEHKLLLFLFWNRSFYASATMKWHVTPFLQLRLMRADIYR